VTRKQSYEPPSHKSHQHDWLEVQIISRLNGDDLPLPHLNMLEENEERIAAAMQERFGFTRGQWEKLSKARQVPYLQKWLGDPNRPAALTDNEYTILRRLRETHPVRQLIVDLALDCVIGRKKCGELCAQLAQRGLVDYAGQKRAGQKQERRGAAITPEGEALLAKETSALKDALKTP
jgi:hypothetical protein